MAAHTEPACRDLAPVHLPVTERLAADSITLPLYHELTEADQDRVVAVVRSVLLGAP
jgi:perosamine synthetase